MALIKSSLLFTIFINDLIDYLRALFPDVYIHLYADDTQIYIVFDPDHVDDAIDLMNEILKATCEWCNNNKVIINPKKSHSIIFSATLLTPRNSLRINNVVIELLDVVRNLGLFMDTGHQALLQ